MLPFKTAKQLGLQELPLHHHKPSESKTLALKECVRAGPPPPSLPVCRDVRMPSSGTLINLYIAI